MRGSGRAALVVIAAGALLMSWLAGLRLSTGGPGSQPEPPSAAPERAESESERQPRSEVLAACADLNALEDLVLREPLGREVELCLETLRDGATRDSSLRASRILIESAFRHNDRKLWGERARLHVTALEPSAADLMVRLAFMAWGNGRHEEVFMWAARAQEHVHEYDHAHAFAVKRKAPTLRSAMKLQLSASRNLWREARKRARVDPTDALRHEAHEWRDRTEALARSWTDLLLTEGVAPDEAREMCREASGLACE